MKLAIARLITLFTILSACALAPVVVVTGCKSTPATNVYRATGTAKITVDAAMTAWGDYVEKFRPPLAEEAAVKAAFQKYQLAEEAILDAAIEYETATANANAEQQSSALNVLNATVAAASAALGDLTSLITSFGVELKPSTL